jgi:hypothetical protein
VLDKQLMQFNQGRDRHPRRPQLHPGTSGGIEHPCRDDHDVAGCHLDMNNLAAGAPLDVLLSNPPPIQRMPAVMNLNLLPDMGRMTVRLPWAENRGCSLGPIAAASAPRQSIR